MAENNTTEKSEIEASQPKVESFDIDKAMNTQGFAEFLAKYPGVEDFDMSNAEEIKARFEVFQAKEVVKKGLKELYAGEIQAKMGIHLDDHDLSCVDKSIDSDAMAYPSYILRMEKKLQAFKELPAKIKYNEELLEQFGNSENWAKSLEAKKNVRQNFETAKGLFTMSGKLGLIGRKIGLYARIVPLVFLPKSSVDSPYAMQMAEDRQQIHVERSARKALEDKYGRIDDEEQANKLRTALDEEIKATEVALSTMKDMANMKTSAEDAFNNLRMNLLGGMADFAEINEVIKSKVIKEFQGIMSNVSLESFDEAQQRLEELQKARETTETGVDPFGGSSFEDIQVKLDKKAEEVAIEQVRKNIERVSFGQNYLTRLEASLEPFLKREKVGSRKGDEARAVIAKCLKEASAKLDSSTASKTKRLMIARILVKINQK